MRRSLDLPLQDKSNRIPVVSGYEWMAFGIPLRHVPHQLQPVPDSCCASKCFRECWCDNNLCEIIPNGLGLFLRCPNIEFTAVSSERRLGKIIGRPRYTNRIRICRFAVQVRTSPSVFSALAAYNPNNNTYIYEHM